MNILLYTLAVLAVLASLTKASKETTTQVITEGVKQTTITDETIYIRLLGITLWSKNTSNTTVKYID